MNNRSYCQSVKSSFVKSTIMALRNLEATSSMFVVETFSFPPIFTTVLYAATCSSIQQLGATDINTSVIPTWVISKGAPEPTVSLTLLSRHIWYSPEADWPLTMLGVNKKGSIPKYLMNFIFTHSYNFPQTFEPLEALKYSHTKIITCMATIKITSNHRVHIISSYIYKVASIDMGVVSNLCVSLGTGVGRNAQETPNITFSNRKAS